ncbi:hypothetical protein B0H12DRAFT_1221881, partial [Mycena haematopus]
PGELWYRDANGAFVGLYPFVRTSRCHAAGNECRKRRYRSHQRALSPYLTEAATKALTREQSLEAASVCSLLDIPCSTFHPEQVDYHTLALDTTLSGVSSFSARSSEFCSGVQSLPSKLFLNAIASLFLSHVHSATVHAAPGKTCWLERPHRHLTRGQLAANGNRAAV